MLPMINVFMAFMTVVMLIPMGLVWVLGIAFEMLRLTFELGRGVVQTWTVEN